MSTASDQLQEALENASSVGDPNRMESPPSGAVELPFVPNNNEAMGQSSPPHNYRHSRAYRHFKNPPQPHMCIRVTTAAGEELFINVLSWTRIVIPQEPSDPIPLYGGMKVPPGSPRCPPLVYAVMANPEVLKDSGRHSKDPEERRAMVELMCDFVEAMNPDVKLTRNAVILKDRDISGELKDVWNAVQAQRDREREEQISQQHFHTAPPQPMFLPQKQQSPQHQPIPNVNNNATITSTTTPAAAGAVPDNKVLYMEFGPESAPTYQPSGAHLQQSSGAEVQKSLDNNPPTAVAQSAINNSGSNFNSLNEMNKKQTDANDISDTISNDQTDSKSIKNGAAGQQQTNNLVLNNVVNNSHVESNASPATAEIQTVPIVMPASPVIATVAAATTISSSQVAVVPSILGEDVFLNNITPEEAQKLITKQDLGLKYAPKLGENPLPASRSANGYFIYQGRKIANPGDYVEDHFLANQFHGQDGLGRALFGYSDWNQGRVEAINGNGDVRGSYKYVDPNGNDFVVNYWSDSLGFHHEDNRPKVVLEPVTNTPEVQRARDEHFRQWHEAAEKARASPDPNSDIYNRNANRWDEDQDRIDQALEITGGVSNQHQSLTRYPNLSNNKHVVPDRDYTASSSQDSVTIDRDDPRKYNRKIDDAEPTGPPHGFFYSFDYPVQLLRNVKESQPGSEYRSNVDTTYNTQQYNVNDHTSYKRSNAEIEAATVALKAALGPSLRVDAVHDAQVHPKQRAAFDAATVEAS